MAGGIGKMLAFFRQAQPRGAPPSGWALTFDAAVAVGAAIGAVTEVAQRVRVVRIIAPDPMAVGVLAAHPVSAHISVAAFAAATLTALPLAGRRLYPIGTWLTITTAIVVVRPASVPPVALGTALYAAYSAIAHSRYRNLAIAVVAVVTIAVAAALGNQLPRFPGRLTAILAITPAAVAGFGIRELRRRLADSTAKLRRASAEAEAATRRALAAERARIASELHDVVTHNVSVMIVQAGAARTVLASSPADAQAALLAVEATGRAAMAELRSLLGLLSPPAEGTDGVDGSMPGLVTADTPISTSVRADRRPGARTGSVSLRPQPGLSDLNALVSWVSAAGLPVSLRVSGEPRPLSAGADLAAYRVVQEALTNVLRHAGRTAAAVAVHWGETLQITISDDGQGAGAGRGTTVDGARDGAAAGRGLSGLRERLSLYGGQLDAGPRPGGAGWQVRAVLPG